MPQGIRFAAPTITAADMSAREQHEVLATQATATIVAAAIENGAIDDSTNLSVAQKRAAIAALINTVQVALWQQNS